MSICESMTNFINHNFREPPVYARVASMLRGGAQMVKVKYRNCHEARYYTGTGYQYNDRLGKRKRWMMEVHRFDKSETDDIRRFISLGLPWMHAGELELLLNWDGYNVYSIEEVKFFEIGVTPVKNELTDIVRRLKPGQGYIHNSRKIEQDFIQPDGFLLRAPGCEFLVPEQYIASQLAFDYYKPDQPFAPKQVYVADPKLIKRQHRPNHDLKRWVVVKQVPSVSDNWAIRYTHGETAGAPVFYYSVDINIDNKAMKAHPFYITALVNNALEQVTAIHSGGHYYLEQAEITITWNGQTKPLLVWMEDARKFPASLDEQPNVIYKTLNNKATGDHYPGPRFSEVKDDQA